MSPKTNCRIGAGCIRTARALLIGSRFTARTFAKVVALAYPLEGDLGLQWMVQYHGHDLSDWIAETAQDFGEPIRGAGKGHHTFTQKLCEAHRCPEGNR